jgi:molybdopterin-guanine dinucleotide biosynthesis protein A
LENSAQARPRICAIILAGGRGRRMGMQNKGLLQFHNQALIAHIIQRLSPQISRIVISANQELERYQQFGLPVIPDVVADQPGPLGGIYSVMRAEKSDWFITCPCDTPYLPLDYVSRMTQAIIDAEVYVAHDGVRQQNGFCLLHQRTLAVLEQALEQRQFAMYRFLESLAAQTVSFADEADAFININTPEELTKLAKTIKSATNTAESAKGK